MIKILVFSLIVSVVSFMLYCTKGDKSGGGELSKEVVGTQAVNVPLKVVADPGNSHCPCAPGFASCNSDCMFSDCCVCWDPTKETGACGCYFGVAKCLTDLINKPQSGSTARTVKLYNVRFKSHLKFLDALGGDTKILKSRFDELSLKGKPGKDLTKGDFLDVDAGSYNSFFDAYKSFIEGLDLKQKGLVQSRLASQLY